MSRQNETKTFEEKLQELQELRELRELRETLSRIRESNSDQTRDQEQRQDPALLEMIDKCVNNIEEVEQWVKLWTRMLQLRVPELEENTETGNI